jgi:uridine kinase
MTRCYRTALLTQLATTIAYRRIGRPLRVAVDGRTAAGKTTMSDELAALIQGAGREVIRTSIDGFHRSKAERYVRGRYSAEGYYYDARDFSAARRLLLDPLGPNGDRRYCTASFDLENDCPVQQDAQTASADAVLIVDGTFLLRPELLQGWDLSIFIEASPQMCEHRGVERDASGLGGAEAARELYATRYRPAFELYETLCAPASAADVVFNNDDFDRPRMMLREGGLLSMNTFLHTRNF